MSPEVKFRKCEREQVMSSVSSSVHGRKAKGFCCEKTGLLLLSAVLLCVLNTEHGNKFFHAKEERALAEREPELQKHQFVSVIGCTELKIVLTSRANV